VLNVNSPPNAWTIAITYTGGGISAPSGVAVDQTGNVWLSNSGNNSVTRLDPNGNALSPNAGYTGSFNAPSAIAIDQGGYAWVTNSGNNSLVQLSPAGTSPTILTGNGLTAPHAIAIDATGSVFVANKTSVSSFTNSGAVLNSSGSTAATPAPSALAINPK
jgi:streptogramin lyase